MVDGTSFGSIDVIQSKPRARRKYNSNTNNNPSYKGKNGGGDESFLQRNGLRVP